MKIITISGPARSGKDFVADEILKRLNNAKKYALADLLKEYLCELLSIDLVTLNEYKNSCEPFTKNGLTMRTIIQRFGTEIFVNKVDKLFWCKRLLEKMNNDEVEYALVSDVRFIHEIEFFEGAFRIKVIGPEMISECSHQSERDLDGYKSYDFILDNSEKKDISNSINVILNKVM